ncbi:MAG: methionyl-tRNA formyltransferase [Bacteroidota bacterium]
MEISTLRIVYMGTPEFAVAPLQKLLEGGGNVVAVITAPDRPAGRGKKIRQTAVKEFATEKGLPVLQPENLKDPEFISQLKQLAPDLQVVVAFRMLPELVWQIPTLGTFNLHASLLPDYRGAAPINHAIINGETRTGVTSFMIDKQIDTGNILLQEETAIGEDETAGQLHDRLMAMGASLVFKTAQQLAVGNLEARSQDKWIKPGVMFNKAPKIHKEDCRIDWNRPGKTVANLIRGLSPYPGAFTRLDKGEEKKILCKIYHAAFVPAIHNHQPGTIITDGKKAMKVAVEDGFIQVYSLQQEGKRKMETEAFLSGINMISFQPRFS